MISISNMKRKCANLELTTPQVITQNGVPSMVIMSYSDWEKEQELLRTLILLTESVIGGTSTSKEFNQRLQKRKEVALRDNSRD